MTLPPPRSTLFPYTTLFRSSLDSSLHADRCRRDQSSPPRVERNRVDVRSEEHTSELQSRGHLVCRLLLEKKNISLDPPRPAADVWRNLSDEKSQIRKAHVLN